MKISSPNLDKVVAGLKALVSGIPIAALQSTKIIANQIFDDSLNVPPTCPEDTGNLRATGRVESVRQGYAIVYGGKYNGKFVDYAAYVHDDLRPRKYTLPGSGPKFVEAHVLRRVPEAPPKVAAVLEELAENIGRTYWR